MNKIEFQGLFVNRFGFQEQAEIYENLQSISIQQELVDFLTFLLPVFETIVNAALNSVCQVALVSKENGTVSIELLLKTELAADPYLNISFVTGFDNNLAAMRQTMMRRKLINVYQTHDPGENDTMINGLPYMELRGSLRKLLTRMANQNNAFIKAMHMRTGSLGALMDTFENDFQLLNDATDGVLKAYRIYREPNENLVYSVCIQAFLPTQIEGSVADIMRDSNRVALMN